MQCLSCHRETPSSEMKLWEKQLLLCPECSALADKELRELEQAHRRAEAQTKIWLVQKILEGVLVKPLMQESV